MDKKPEPKKSLVLPKIENKYQASKEESPDALLVKTSNCCKLPPLVKPPPKKETCKDGAKGDASKEVDNPMFLKQRKDAKAQNFNREEEKTPTSNQRAARPSHSGSTEKEVYVSSGMSQEEREKSRFFKIQYPEAKYRLSKNKNRETNYLSRFHKQEELDKKQCKEIPSGENIRDQAKHALTTPTSNDNPFSDDVFSDPFESVLKKKALSLSREEIFEDYFRTAKELLSGETKPWQETYWKPKQKPITLPIRPHPSQRSVGRPHQKLSPLSKQPDTTIQWPIDNPRLPMKPPNKTPVFQGRPLIGFHHPSSRLSPPTKEQQETLRLLELLELRKMDRQIDEIEKQLSVSCADAPEHAARRSSYDYSQWCEAEIRKMFERDLDHNTLESQQSLSPEKLQIDGQRWLSQHMQMYGHAACDMTVSNPRPVRLLTKRPTIMEQYTRPKPNKLKELECHLYQLEGQRHLSMAAREPSFGMKVAKEMPPAAAQPSGDNQAKAAPYKHPVDHTAIINHYWKKYASLKQNCKRQNKRTKPHLPENGDDNDSKGPQAGGEE